MGHLLNSQMVDKEWGARKREYHVWVASKQGFWQLPIIIPSDIKQDGEY